MTGNMKVHHKMAVDQVTRLKPHKLGRHIHKIPQYIRDLINKHPRVISDYFLRNYRVNIELERVTVHELHSLDADNLFQCELGKVGFAMDRSLLAEVLECYYGGTGMPGSSKALSADKEEPISQSEQRMRNRLGMDVAQIFARTLLGGESFGKLQNYDNAYEEVEWEYVAELHYHSHITGVDSSIFIYLDTHLADELTERLVPPSRAPMELPLDTEELLLQLPVRLTCVIGAAQIPLQQTLSLKPGDVIPIRMRDRCEVAVNQQKLFRGAVFEDDGSLFLTSLEMVKAL